MKNDGGLIFKISISVIAILTGCIAAGFFTMHEKNTPDFESGADNQKIISHKKIDTVIDGNKQVINILEVRPGTGVVIKPVLAQDGIFGFETTSSMTLRSNAYAGINGGFFHQYGQPSGLVVSDKKVLAKAEGAYPVFAQMEDGKYYIGELKDTNNVVVFGNMSIRIDGINRAPAEDETILFTAEYGKDNRLSGKTHSNVIIEKNRVKKVINTDDAAEIPRDGATITFTGRRKSEAEKIEPETEAVIHANFEPDIGEVVNAYQCGSWIVKNGSIVIKDKDEWIGLTTNRDPRSAVGIKNDGTVVLITVDGRQPGYSIGMTGKELGEYLVGLNVMNAAMLDGGASATMVVDGTVVNRPSLMGKERIIGGALVVIKKPERLIAERDIPK